MGKLEATAHREAYFKRQFKFLQQAVPRDHSTIITENFVRLRIVAVTNTAVVVSNVKWALLYETA